MTASAPTDRGRPVNWPRMRPRFTLEVGCPAEHVMEALHGAADEPAPDIESRLSERHGVLTLPEAERQFWSTQLGLTVVDAEVADDGVRRATRIHGVFSPHPEIWTAYVFTIGTLTVIGVFGPTMGFTRPSIS